ncbi:rCG51798 [Rattus norvegicus]|uniref:RCG51798 n=1 Tax=Rattus norvegicus TaxID=10116 RepID=A6K3C7_RAT|nr:rCG51798 [Rattus norvegicus]
MYGTVTVHTGGRKLPQSLDLSGQEFLIHSWSCFEDQER